jgi:hypothetical protein
MTIDAVIGIVGSFISILVTIMVFMLVSIQKQMGGIANKMEGKLDITDHDKQAQACAQALKDQAMTITGRLEDRITTIDRKLCNHWHPNNTEINFRSGGGL